MILLSGKFGTRPSCKDSATESDETTFFNGVGAQQVIN